MEIRYQRAAWTLAYLIKNIPIFLMTGSIYSKSSIAGLLSIVLLAPSISFSVHARKKLDIGSPEFPPYVYALDNEKIGGAAAEIVAKVFQSMGTNFENRLYPWTRVLQMLTDGKIHAVYTMMKNKKREALFYYPAEHLFYTKWVFFIRRSDAGTLKFDSFDDLKGKKIGLIRDTKYTKELWGFVRKENNYELVTLNIQNMRKLAANRVDYVCVDYTSGMLLVKELGLENEIVALTGNPIESTPLFIVFSPKKVDKEIVDRFSEELKNFKSSTEYQKILEKYNISR